jgi:PPP family 3-phenylpropionic acid transporter
VVHDVAHTGLRSDVKAAAPPSLRGLSSRISVMYAAIYLHYGAFGLFIPLWFAHRGLTPEQIGALMSLPMLLRIFFVAPVTGLADRLRRIREVLLACVIGAMLLMSVMSFAHSYIELLIFFTLFSVVWDPLPILADAYAVIAVRTQAFDFGRMRLWGSLAFIVANIASGSLVGSYSAEIIPWVTALSLAIPIVPILLLPPDRNLGPPQKLESKEWRAIVVDPVLIGVMIAAALVSASNAVLGVFGAIQMSAMGLSGTMIGVMWALGIGSEIVVLFVAQRLLGPHSPLWLILIGGAVAVLRWVLMSTHPGLYELAALQLLNGITGMGATAGLMLFIGHRVDARLISTAQGINAVVAGVAAALAAFASGYAWHTLGYNSYLLAALVAGLGAALTLPALSKTR